MKGGHRTEHMGGEGGKRMEKTDGKSRTKPGWLSPHGTFHQSVSTEYLCVCVRGLVLKSYSHASKCEEVFFYSLVFFLFVFAFIISSENFRQSSNT